MPDLDGETLIGRRFVTDFRVLGVGHDPERTVILTMYGDTYKISLEELKTVIECGFVTEIG